MGAIDIGIDPSFFFELMIDCYPYTPERGWKKEHQLPSMSIFGNRLSYAEAWIGYDDEGIFLAFQMTARYQKSYYPKYQQGDAVEVFFETKGRREMRWTSSSHHFVLLPDRSLPSSENRKEIPHHAGNSQHPIQEHSSLYIEYATHGYRMECFFSREVLDGCIPKETGIMGFDYIIHRKGEPSQSFFGPSQSIHNHPNLWAQLQFQRSI